MLEGIYTIIILYDVEVTEVMVDVRLNQWLVLDDQDVQEIDEIDDLEQM